MSSELTKEVVCPHCGKAVKTRMWASISAEISPDLRRKILDETLFDWKCPACSRELQLVYPCLYHDKGRRFMVYVAPGEESPRSVQAVTEFPQLAQVRKRTVASLAELKEKIMIFEAGLDDQAVELVKLALCDVLWNKYHRKAAACFFCYVDEPADRMGFSVFLEGDAQPIRQRTKFEVYRRSREVLEALDYGETTDFSFINADTARTLLETYQKRTGAQG